MDDVAGANHPANKNNGHDSAFPLDGAVLRATKHFAKQARLETVDLLARIAETSHPHGRVLAESQDCVRWETKQIDAPGGDVFAHLARRHGVTRGGHLVKQLGMDQMHLPKIGLRRIAGHPGEMLHGDAGVRIPVHTPALNKHDLVNDGFAELMVGVAADGNNAGP